MNNSDLKGTKNMNITIERITTTVEEADSLIESLNLTEKVDDYEENELGHVYTLQDGSAVTVTSPTTYTHC
jgi:hypothetical protein